MDPDSRHAIAAPARDEPCLPIVGIGASSGGLEAVTDLLSALRGDCGMSFLLVQHLDPTHASLLTDILTRKTALTVVEAAAGMEIECNHLYVIPPNTVMTVERGRLELKPRGEAPGPIMPIDSLLQSLAHDQGARAIGVILSGQGSDGSLGLSAIKQQGGITFAQDTGSARYSSMPCAAVALGCVDYVLPPPEIALELARIGRHPYVTAPAAGASEELRQEDEASLQSLFATLRNQCAVDFSHYKRGTVTRRVSRRMVLQRADTLADYVALLEGNAAEAQAMCQDLLICVTEFFRDPESFEGLNRLVFPRIVDAHAAQTPIRIWVPGCASGEEVYSIAICLLEYLRARGSNLAIQIFGTDLNEAALTLARTGVYASTIERRVSAERLSRFFVPLDGRYQVSKTLRDLCVFAHHNVTADVPFSRMDIVSCRNLLIYLDPVLQKRVIPMFHYALEDGGLLLLGPSETIGGFTDLFGTLDHENCRAYVRKPRLRRGPFSGLPAFVTPRRAPDEPPPSLVADGSARLQQRADRIAALRYAPAGVICDDDLDIVEFRGETGPYLTHPPGPPNLNLKHLARPGLLVDLSDAVRQAGEGSVAVRRVALRVDGPGGMRPVRIDVVPVEHGAERRWYLVFFADEQVPPPVSTRVAQPLRNLWSRWLERGGIQAAEALRDTVEEQNRHLRLELDAMHRHLRRLQEEHESATEELKSSQEELLSSNEEFQSTNEELETAKEEVQSSYEELSTTNDELRQRNVDLLQSNTQLSQARDYADAIVQTVTAPLLILDVQLNVMRANAAFYRFFHATAKGTEHCRLYDLGNGQWNIPELRSLLHELLDQPGDGHRSFEVTHLFPSIGVRTLALNAAKLVWPDHSLILLSIDDITARRAALSQLQDAGERKDEFLAMLAHELRGPLAPMRSAVSILQNAQPDAAERGQAQAVLDRQLDKFSRLVDDLLDTARVTSGHITLQKERLDLRGAVRLAASSAQAHLHARQHALTLTVPDQPLEVDGDASRLDQVIFNLLTNATKYTEPGGDIQLSLERQGSEAVITVSDNGTGISPNLLPVIFDLFVQEPRALDRSQGGLGIGLTVVRRITELHGGTVTASSPGLNQGSTFVVRLPALPGTTPMVARRADGAADGRPEPRRILVVDDNEDSVAMNALILRLDGHDVETAGDGLAAVEAARRFRPDIVLLDIGLPGMNGYDVARALRADPALEGLVLIAVSGYGRDVDRQRAVEAGFDHYLVKPASATQIRAAIAGYRAAAAAPR